MGGLGQLNYILLFLFPVFVFFRVASRRLLHPVIISLLAGVLPFLIGVQFAVSPEPALTEKFFYIILAIYAGTFLGSAKKARPDYSVAVDPAGAITHLAPFKAAVVFAIAVMAVFFMAKGIPILADEPNIAKVTITRGGGWIFTRFVRYFLLLFFYAAVAGAFFAARSRMARLGRPGGPVRLRTLIRYGGPWWLVMGVVMLTLFSFLGYKATVIAFFLWTFCFFGLFSDVRIRQMLPLVVVGLAASIWILMMIQNSEGVMDLLTFIYYRTTQSATEGLLYVFNNYGVKEPYLRGEGFWYDISNIFMKLGLGSVLPFELHDLNFDALIFKKILGHNEYGMQATTSIFGQLYANFGLPATLAGTSAFFYLYARFGNMLVSHRKSLLSTPVYFLLFQQYQTFIAGGPFLITIFDTAMSLAIFFGLYAGIYLLMRLPAGTLSFRSP